MREKITTGGRTAKERDALRPEIQQYREVQSTCEKAVETWVGPALRKALADLQDETYPATFPRRAAKEGPSTTDGAAGSRTAGKRKASRSAAAEEMDGWQEMLSVPAVLLPSSYHRDVRSHTAMKDAC